MALESSTYINGLVVTNPTGSDNISDGDNHIRLLKSTIKATFPNVTGAVTKSHTQLNTTVATVEAATNANTASTIVKRNGSGDFNAGTITAALSGNATTATTLQTSRTIALAGDVTGSVSFNGSQNVSITATVADDSHNHVTSNIDGFTEAVQDVAGGMFSGNTETGVSAAYQDGDGTVDLVLSTEYVQDIVGAMFTGNTETGLSATYQDSDGTIDLSLTQDPTITLSGDVSGSGTMTNLNSVNIAVSIVDDSHNHTITNVDGLQAALDAKVDDGQVLTNVPSNAVFTDTNTTYTAGSGLTLSGTTFTNAAPDRTVSLTGSGATSVSGSYPNFTISSTDNNTTYSVGNGGLTQINFTSALNSKLAGIEAGATADQTAAEIVALAAGCAAGPAG